MKTTLMDIKFFLKSYFLRLLMGTMLVVIQTSCGPPAPTAQIFLEVVEVTVDPKANQDTAVAMDLVVVYEEGLLNTLLKLSASAYFAQKKQIIRDNPGQIYIWSWEVVPGQIVPPRQIKLPQTSMVSSFFDIVSFNSKKIQKPQGGLFFANYLTPGDHRIRVGKETGAKITLGPKDFSLQPFEN